MPKSLEFLFVGRDKSLGKTLRGVGKDADHAHSRMAAFAGGLAGGALAAGVIQFGKASAAAFKEAERAQAELSGAFEKFPKLADTNVKALQKLNTELARKTRFDDDALASGQSILAQFNLTGKQIEQVTPLLADYAARTGQDIPTAAKALGMAFNGNAKALKQIGIVLPKAASGAQILALREKQLERDETRLTKARRKMADTQDLLRGKTKLSAAESVRLRNAQLNLSDAETQHKDSLKALSAAQKGASKNGDVFAQVMGGLNEKVRGFAERDGKTAAGQAEILKNRYGELQETVGSHLVPALNDMAGKLLSVLDFADRNSKVIKPLVIAVGGFAAAVWTVNKAVAAGKSVMAASTAVRALFTFGVVKEGQAATVTAGQLGTLTLAEGAAGTAGGAAAAGGLTRFAVAAGRIGTTVGAAYIAVDAFVHLLDHMLKQADATANVLNGTKTVGIDLPKQKPVIHFNGHDYAADGSGEIGVRPNGSVTSVSPRNKTIGVDGRARGGNIEADRAYLVGERGPELVTPHRSGYVHTAAQTQRMLINPKAKLDTSQIVDNRRSADRLLLTAVGGGRGGQRGALAPAGMRDYISYHTTTVLDGKKIGTATTRRTNARVSRGHLPPGLL